MVIGYHVIFGAYGHWLPNDVRGSWSEFVGSWELLRYGPATTTPNPILERLAPGAQPAHAGLKYPAVHFTGVQARAVGRGFADRASRSKLSVWACSILPEHVHLVIGRHGYVVEQIVNLLKGAASRRLTLDGVHPLGSFPTRCGRFPKPWARGQWAAFLSTPDGVARAIQYVEENPIKEGKPRQRWPFVTAFDANLYPYWVTEQRRR